MMDVRYAYLSTSVGCAQKVADSGTSNGCCSTGITTLNGRDSSNWTLLLTEASLDVGDHGRNENNLGNHIDGYVWI
jgi:hypothetical protein